MRLRDVAAGILLLAADVHELAADVLSSAAKRILR